MQPGCLPLALGVLVLSSLFALFGCSGGATSTEQASYPLDFCIVSGNDFGEDPDMIPYVHVYKGTPIKFCCKPCLPRFEKDPERYLAFMKEEIEALSKDPQP